MKKTKILLCALCVVLTLALCACGGGTKLYNITEENAWWTFPVEESPVKTVNAGEKWYSLLGTYLGNEFSLSVSESYGEINVVYSTHGADIWFFEANEHCAAWSERSAEGLRFMVYNAETGETKEVYGTEYGELFEPANVGVFGKSVYFAAVDHAAKSAAVMRFSVETGELSELCALEYRAEYTCTSLSADGSTLLLSFGNAGKAKLLKLDLEGGNKAETALEAGADFVYGCAYDSAEGGLAVYYRDTDGREHIGTVNAKNGRIKNIYTFSENVYAYRDTLELHGGFLYWVTQINATGSVADHYKFVVYDCKKDTAKEYLKTFSFSLEEDGVTLLAFNSVNFDAIYLTKIYLGGLEE